MTSTLRRKRRTTPRGRSTAVRTAVKLALAALAAAGLAGPAAAQQPQRVMPYTAAPIIPVQPPMMPQPAPPPAALAGPAGTPADVMRFQKDPVPPQPGSRPLPGTKPPKPPKVKP